MTSYYPATQLTDSEFIIRQLLKDLLSCDFTLCVYIIYMYFFLFILAFFKFFCSLFVHVYRVVQKNGPPGLF